MALSPFMIFFSGNGRAYTLMIMLLAGSTIAMLLAERDRPQPVVGRLRAPSCLAMYSHYTAFFILAAQLAWLLVMRPGSWIPALVANAGAAVLFLPWIPGLRSDLDSPTTEVLEALQGTGFEAEADRGRRLGVRPSLHRPLRRCRATPRCWSSPPASSWPPCSPSSRSGAVPVTLRSPCRRRPGPPARHPRRTAAGPR